MRQQLASYHRKAQRFLSRQRTMELAQNACHPRLDEVLSLPSVSRTDIWSSSSMNRMAVLRPASSRYTPSATSVTRLLSAPLTAISRSADSNNASFMISARSNAQGFLALISPCRYTILGSSPAPWIGAERILIRHESIVGCDSVRQECGSILSER